jgi:hypothetical protein
LGNFIIPEVYLYVFDALPILACTAAFSIILPWQLDYAKAVGDVLEKLEWGILLPIVWPIKLCIQKRKENKADKVQELNELRSGHDSTDEVQLSK